MDETDDLALGVWLEEHLRNFSHEIAAEKKKAVFDLSNSHLELPTLVGILMTNGFEIPAEEDWPFCRGLFLQISRINHACEPNCAQRWVGGDRRVMMIVPVKDIEAGEEITVTYLPDGACQSVGERREWLMNEFGFWCECELCVSESEGVVNAELGVLTADPQEDDKAEEAKINSGKEKPDWNFKW